MRLARAYTACLGIAMCLVACLMPISGLAAKDFVVVIDAGHGGHDPGAVGKTSKEKDINLRVALRVGKLIEDNCKDVRVVYTRTKDVFVPLMRRAEIANAAKADLFISIHTNALPKNNTFQGASTYTLGLAKSDANLDVAKRENSVILYEDDYRTRYAGFDPNSAESYIIFEFMQDTYMAQSVKLAQLVQQEMKQTCRRVDRGVHQAGFLVLKESAMPSILVELGFISTPAEERYLNTSEGVNQLANGIYRAFCTYKRQQQEGSADSEVAQPAQPSPPAEAPGAGGQSGGSPSAGSQPVFKVQILTASKPLPKGDKRLKGLTDVEYYVENGIYKYTTGATTDYNQASQTRKKLTALFKDAFIVAFKNGKKMDVNQAINEFKHNKKP